MRKWSNWYVFLIGVIALSGCSGDVSFTSTVKIDESGWNANDTVTISPQIDDVSTTYDVTLWVRHDKEYDYSNLWLKLISDPLLTADSTFLQEIQLADKAGRWLGVCSQSMCTKRVLLKEGLQFDQSESFKLDILQYMREDELSSISDIGLEITPSASEL